MPWNELDAEPGDAWMSSRIHVPPPDAAILYMVSAAATPYMSFRSRAAWFSVVLIAAHRTRRCTGLPMAHRQQPHYELMGFVHMQSVYFTHNR